MSKNTERGIGQHVGPAADGRPDDARPRLASETSIVGPTPEKLDRDAKVPDGHGPKVEVAQITLLGVSAPELDREKLTTPGRDVHLPTEVRRVASPRAIALDAAASAPGGDRRKTPETPRPRVTSTSAPSIPLHTQDVMSTVNARLSDAGEVTRGEGPRREGARGEGTRGAARSSGRRDFGETTLMDAVPETGRGGEIALGAAISLVAAVAVVWTLRFGPHLRFEVPVAERSAPPSEPARALPRTAPPARELRVPGAPQAGTSLPADGEPSGSNPAAGTTGRELAAPDGTSAARERRLDDEPPAAARENPEGAARDARSAVPSGSSASDEDGRRKSQRLRPPPSSSSERGGSSAARRAPAPPIFRGGDDPGLPPTSPPAIGSGRTAPPEPPRFEPPPPPPPRPAPTRTDEKPTYDPDSPLPPAAGGGE